MTRETFQRKVTGRVPSSYRSDLPQPDDEVPFREGAVSSNSHLQTDTGERLSAFHRLVLTCLVANGGQRSIVRLAGDVRSYRRGADPTFQSDVQNTYLSVREAVEHLATQGLVTYSDEVGDVSLC